MMNITRIDDKAYAAFEKVRAYGLAAPKLIVFGSHKLLEVGEIAYPYAGRDTAMVLLGARSARKFGALDRLCTILDRYRIKVELFEGIGREPTVEIVNRAVEQARKVKPKLIISLGGGSVIDTGKAVAALAVNPGQVQDYLEGVGKGLKLAQPPLPHIAIPTTAGTGSEMTKNAVITSPEQGFKKSMRFEEMIPTAAIIDPELTLSVPAHITAFGGMDALTQLIEPCISRKRQPKVTELALEALRNVQLGLSVAYEDPGNLMARERMAYVSAMSGICLANAGLAMAHGIAAALGALYDVPHGLACAVLLPHSLRYNAVACKQELAEALAAFMNLSRADDNTIEEGIAGIESLARWLQIPPDLKFLHLKDDDLRRLAAASMGSSMSANPVPMTADKVYEFLKLIA